MHCIFEIKHLENGCGYRDDSWCGNMLCHVKTICERPMMNVTCTGSYAITRSPFWVVSISAVDDPIGMGINVVERKVKDKTFVHYMLSGTTSGSGSFLRYKNSIFLLSGIIV